MNEMNNLSGPHLEAPIDAVATDPFTIELGSNNPIVQISADFRIFCEVPKNIIFDAEMDWQYNAIINENGNLTGVQSINDPMPTNRIINIKDTAEALKDSKAVIENHIMGISLFKNMFPVPQYDFIDENGNRTKLAYAVYMNQYGLPMSPFDENENAYIRQDPLNEAQAISPIDPNTSEVIPVATQVSPQVMLHPNTTYDMSKIIVTSPEQNGYYLMMVLINIDNNTDISILYKETHLVSGEFVAPLDNAGNAFKISDNNKLQFPPNRIPVTYEQDTESSMTVPLQLSTMIQTSHAGKRVLQIMAHYFTNSPEDIDIYFGSDSIANEIVHRIATLLANSIQTSHEVRQSILDQVYFKIGPHAFTLDGNLHPVREALITNAIEPLTLCIHLDQQFRIGVLCSKSFRNVTIKKLPIVVRLV